MGSSGQHSNCCNDTSTWGLNCKLQASILDGLDCGGSGYIQLVDIQFGPMSSACAVPIYLHFQTRTLLQTRIQRHRHLLEEVASVVSRFVFHQSLHDLSPEALARLLSKRPCNVDRHMQALQLQSWKLARAVSIADPTEEALFHNPRFDNHHVQAGRPESGVASWQG